MENTMCFICDYCSPYGGNFIPLILEFADSFEKNFDLKLVFVFPFKAKEKAFMSYFSKYDVYYFDNSTKIKAIKSLLKIKRIVKPKYVYSHFVSSFIVNFCFFKKTDIIFCHLHSDFSLGNNKFKGLKDFFRYKIFSKKTYYLSVSPHIVNGLKKKTIVVNNCISLNRFQDSNVLRFQNNNTITMLLLAWIPYLKGLDIAYSFCHRLIQEIGTQIELYVVIGDTDEFVYKDFLEKNNAGMSYDFIHFLKPIENIFNYIEQTDFLLSCSRSEGFPYSVLESLYKHKKCLLSKIPGNLRFANFDGVEFFDLNDADDFIKKFKKLNSQVINWASNDELINNQYLSKTWVDGIISFMGDKIHD